MPGHVKLGKSGEPDPDPSEYLIVSMDMKREDQLKVYDSRKSFWVPDGKGGFMEAMLESDDGKVAKVVVKGYEVCNFIIFFLFTSYIFILVTSFLLLFRKELTSQKNWDKSIHLNLRSARTWQT